MGGVQFSEATIIPHLQVIFWKLVLARRHGEHIRSHFWKQHKNAAKITGEIHLISTPDIVVGAYESLTDQGLEWYQGLQPSGCRVATSSSTPVLIIVCSKLLLEVFSVFQQLSSSSILPARHTSWLSNQTKNHASSSSRRSLSKTKSKS
jgi:hypothetical protein